MKDALLAEARALGFSRCRVTRCTPPPHADAFDQWLDDGMAGEMTPWLDRSRPKRADPQLVLPGARSVVVLALDYWQGPRPPHPPDTLPTGRVARYAWGDDYHDLIQQKLRALDTFLQTHGGQQRYYVDTGPVLERDFAAEAGIGWHGKSTMLLNEQQGTWFFLAELLTTLDLPPDEPVPPRCGTCTRCLDACPTGAIRHDRPYHLDARLCISYLTIEHKGPIPRELRPLLGDRIYGCDDCLEACPWNRFAQTSREATFQARPATVGMALRDYLAMTQEDFSRAFKGSPIKTHQAPGLAPQRLCRARERRHPRRPPRAGTRRDPRGGDGRRTRPLGHRPNPGAVSPIVTFRGKATALVAAPGRAPASFAHDSLPPPQKSADSADKVFFAPYLTLCRHSLPLPSSAQASAVSPPPPCSRTTATG